MKKFFSLPRLKSRNTPVRSDQSERAATSSPVAFDHPPILNSVKRKSKKRTLSLEPTKEEEETSFERVESIEVQDLETNRRKLKIFDSHDLHEIIEETGDESTTLSSTASQETEKKKRRRSWAGFNNIKKHLKDLISNFNHDAGDDINDSVSIIFPLLSIGIKLYLYKNNRYSQ